MVIARWIGRGRRPRGLRGPAWSSSGNMRYRTSRRRQPEGASGRARRGKGVADVGLAISMFCGLPVRVMTLPMLAPVTSASRKGSG